jgi:hypothetical protein
VNPDCILSAYDIVVASDFSNPDPEAITAPLFNATIGVFPPIPNARIPSCVDEGNGFAACPNEGQHFSAPLLNHDWDYGPMS